MAKPLSVADVLNDQIDQHEEERKRPDSRQAARGVKRYRTRSGEYIGQAQKLAFKEADGGPNEGRRFATIQMPLYTTEQKYRGTTWVDISWKRVLTAKGEPDLQFKRFQQVAKAMHAPSNATVEQVVSGIEGQFFLVWGREYISVKVKDLLPQHKDLAGNRGSESTVRVYIDDKQDAEAEQYMDLGYKSRFEVFSIKEVPTAEEVPF